MDIKKKIDETQEQYLWRIGQMVDAGEIDNWASINNIVNKEILGDRVEKYKGESAWRKKYQAAKAFFNNVFSKMIDEEYAKQVDTLNRELARNTVKFRDNRNAWNKQNYADARVDETMELLEETLSTIGKTNFIVDDSIRFRTDGKTTELIVLLSDLHIGETFSSYFGEYNSDIAKERLQKYLSEVISIGKKHNANRVTVVGVGDQISGAIHKTIAITNKENVIDQVKLAIEYISSFCYELSQAFEDVYYYDVSGNHSRLDANKDSALKNERLDDLIGWSVCKMLNHVNNFHDMSHRKIDSTIADANVMGKTYLIMHGDYDNMSMGSIGKLTMAVGFCPDYILMGHRHTPAMAEFNGVKVYQSGSLAGSGDDYTVEKRLIGDPSQTVLVCDSKGVQCCYNVNLK